MTRTTLPRVVLVSAIWLLIPALSGPQAAGVGQGVGPDASAPLSGGMLQLATEQPLPLGLVDSRRVVGSLVNKDLVSVIVKLDVTPLAAYRGGITGLAPTSPSVTGAAKLDVLAPDSLAYLHYVDGVLSTFTQNLVAKIAGAKVVHRYNVVLGGVSLVLPRAQLPTLEAMPGVQAVYPDQLLQPLTDRSPLFIGAPTLWTQLGGRTMAGEGVIVGVLDTGIWPEHPSFSDPDPSGKSYATPVGWNGTACDFGSATPGDAPFTCNNKLLGAERFMATYDVAVGLTPGEFVSARDDDGHGTHTSSTAAGNGTVAASIFGVDRGLVSGIAPRAGVAMYKVCGASGCYSSDSAAAVQQAILDGVDTINFSISGGASPYSDVVSLAFLDAFNAGVFVAASAGNSGPGANTTDHREPWVTTVAASTENRAFENSAAVTADGGASLDFTGASITGGAGPAPVIVPADPFCLTPLAPGSVSGAIVVCERGNSGRVDKGYNVLQGGAAGMILYNQSTAVTDLETDNHFLPTIHTQYLNGLDLLDFLDAGTNVQATLSEGVKTAAQGDVLASFSSRGGTGLTLGVNKPDITAPGVQILAGASPRHVDIAGGPQGELFQAIAGTSMASPHIAGSAALMQALYPGWTPGQIKSALMTTALAAVRKEDGVTPATPFDDGSGRVNLRRAWEAWATIDATGADYLTHQNDLWNANYPSLYLPAIPGRISVQRTLHNELGSGYPVQLTVRSPSDLKITTPSSIYLPAGGDAVIDIAVDASRVPAGETRFATLRLTAGPNDPSLQLPITVVRKDPVVTLSKSCSPASIPLAATTTCTLTATNTVLVDADVSISDSLPGSLRIIPASITGAVQSGNGVVFDGTLAGGDPPSVAVGPGTSPAGYLPLSLFAIAPIGGVGDETISNFNVPAFEFAGEVYTQLGIVSNGYVVVGGGSSSDVSYVNPTPLPDASAPNNVLAPFWTDLNPGVGGAVRIGVLTDGVSSWIVVDWEAVKEYSSASTDSFQIWIGVNGVQDISFVYGPLGGNGDGGLLTVGAENQLGNRGSSYYFDGTGTLPTSSTQLAVTSTPATVGETKTITYQAVGRRLGERINRAILSSDLFQGEYVAPFPITVTP